MIFRQLIFIVTYFLLAVTSSNGMDNSNVFNLDCIEEITIVEEPRRVRYFTDTKLAILGNKGNCIILDLHTKQSQCIVKLGNPCGLDFPMVERNNKKIIMAYDTKVMIYNGETNIKQLIQQIPIQKINRPYDVSKIRSLTVHPADNVLLLCYERSKRAITKYNYVSNTSEEIPIFDQYCRSMALHPKKEIVCIAEYSGKIFLRELNNIIKPLNIIKLPEGDCCFCQYNPDGSCIVAGNNRNLYIIDQYEDTTIPFIATKDYEIIDGISFHSNGLLGIIVTLTRSSIIQYWNLKTQQLIYETPMKYSDQAYDICFSDDGLEVVVAFSDKCIRALVPFAIKEKCSYLLFVLNQLEEKYHVPKDIVQCCIYKFLQYLRF